MSAEFEIYLKALVEHEQEKSLVWLKDHPYESIKVFAGHKLSWLGDYFGNPKIKWQKKQININDIRFTGTNTELNAILIEKCGMSVSVLLDLIETDKDVKNLVEKNATFSDHMIVVRHDFKDGKYLMLDGTHRLLGYILKGDKAINVWYPVNEREYLPECEAHVIYDLIRGFLRTNKDEESCNELYYSLKLLSKTYGNVSELLEKRFNQNYVFDSQVQAIISKVLHSN
jgi:hypothetical protein